MATNRKYAHGRYITATADACTPADPDSGDPCVYGNIPGVAVGNTDQATNQVVLDTGGIYELSVVGADGSGNAAVAVGDLVYLDATVVNADDSNGVRFGYALGAVSSGATTVIQVKLGY